MKFTDIQKIDDLPTLKSIILSDVPDYYIFQAMKRYIELGGNREILYSVLFENKFSRSLRISLSTLVDDYDTLVKFTEMMRDPMLNMQKYLWDDDPIGLFYQEQGMKLTNEFAFLVTKVSDKYLFDVIQKFHDADRTPNACAQYMILRITDTFTLMSLKLILPPCYQSDIMFQLKRQTR